jgi:hypothetical protein
VGLQLGREKTQKLSLLQNGIQKVNRLLEKQRILMSWDHPIQSVNYVLAVTAVGVTILVVPVRWIFLGAVLGKFAPGDTMSRKVMRITPHPHPGTPLDKIASSNSITPKSLPWPPTLNLTICSRHVCVY